MRTPDLSIVVPAFNEAQRIVPTLAALASAAAARTPAFEILVVDDGSTDDTAAIVRRLAEAGPALRLVETRPNRGKGHAVRVGMLAARGAVRVMADADGSTPAEQLDALLAPIADGRAAVAVGSRYVGGRAASDQPWWRRLWSRLVNAYVQRALVPGVADTHCGFKAFTAAAAEDLFGRAVIDGWTFDIEILALACRRGHRIVEVPVSWRDDPRSRVRPLRDLVRCLGEMAALERALAAVAPGR
jgi:dolichyl-phosphate beta-glucosyltransferase